MTRLNRAIVLCYKKKSPTVYFINTVADFLKFCPTFNCRFIVYNWKKKTFLYIMSIFYNYYIILLLLKLVLKLVFYKYF